MKRFSGRARWPAVGVALLIATGMEGCKSCNDVPPKPYAEVCFTLNAGANLNFYDGQSHVVVLYVYPLDSALAFDAANVEDLVGGSGLSGALGKPRELTVAPNQEIAFNEQFPLNTTHIGLVADYYRAPGDPPGTRKASLAAKCPEEGPRPMVALTARDLLVK
jgi:type VI secretion system VasD/TssJ family lipoprotein